MTDADNWTDTETGYETYSTCVLTSASLGYVIATCGPISVAADAHAADAHLLIRIIAQHLPMSIVLFSDTNWRSSICAAGAKLFAVELHWFLDRCLFRIIQAYFLQQ